MQSACLVIYVHWFSFAGIKSRNTDIWQVLCKTSCPMKSFCNIFIIITIVTIFIIDTFVLQNVFRIWWFRTYGNSYNEKWDLVRLHGTSRKPINTLRPRQNGRHFADDIFKCIFLNENVWIPIKISLKFVLKGQINKITALVQIMAWCRPADKPLSEPMMVSLPTHICVIRPQ